MFSRSHPSVLALLTDSSRFADEALAARDEDLWDAWAFAAVDARSALQDWHAAASDDRRSAFVAYRAALDREEHAARVLQRRAGSSRRS
jgi:hypothetical protein